MKEKLKAVQKLLPTRAELKLGRKGKVKFIEIKVDGESLSDEVEDAINKKIRTIVGNDSISEFYTEETGRHWFVYLK